MKTTILLSVLAVFLLNATTSAQKRKNLSQCTDHPALFNDNILMLINVKPVANMEWKFPEAPSVVAKRIFDDLNKNDQLINFKEPNGVLPLFIINVTISETNNGTRRDEAWAEVSGLSDLYGRGSRSSVTLFSEKSGDAPFTTARDAVDHLSENLLVWFKQGWHTTSPCIQWDGSARLNAPSKDSGSASLKSGEYYMDAAGWPSVWTLTISGSSVKGSSEWQCCPGHRVDPL